MDWTVILNIDYSEIKLKPKNKKISGISPKLEQSNALIQGPWMKEEIKKEN